MSCRKVDDSCFVWNEKNSIFHLWFRVASAMGSKFVFKMCDLYAESVNVAEHFHGMSVMAIVVCDGIGGLLTNACSRKLMTT